jgi:hypothetical protein
LRGCRVWWHPHREQGCCDYDSEDALVHGG